MGIVHGPDISEAVHPEYSRKSDYTTAVALTSESVLIFGEQVIFFLFAELSYNCFSFGIVFMKWQPRSSW